MAAPVRAARSHLFAPADNERILAKVFTAGADIVVLDLEDAVAPAEKANARKTVEAALTGRPSAQGPPVWVRINGADTDLWRDDLAAIVGPWLAGIRIPKAESVEAIQQVTEALARREEIAGLELMKSLAAKDSER